MKWGLYPKMLLAFLGLAIVPIVLIGSFLYVETKGALTNEAYSKLEAIRDAKKATVTQHIDEKFLNLEALAENEQVQQAFAPLTKQFADGGLANDAYQHKKRRNSIRISISTSNSSASMTFSSLIQTEMSSTPHSRNRTSVRMSSPVISNRLGSEKPIKTP